MIPFWMEPCPPFDTQDLLDKSVAQRETLNDYSSGIGLGMQLSDNDNGVLEAKPLAPSTYPSNLQRLGTQYLGNQIQSSVFNQAWFRSIIKNTVTCYFCKVAFVGSDKIRRNMFSFYCSLGRRVGGIPPRRIGLGLAKRSYLSPGSQLIAKDFWGLNFELDPFYHIDANILALGAYEKPLGSFLRRQLKTGDIVVDVGANIGVHTLHMAKLISPNGLVYAFEPNPEAHDRLLRNIQLNHLTNVLVQSQALGAMPGSAILRGGSRDERNPGSASLRPGVHSAGEVQVEVDTLDNVARNLGMAPTLVKVDIEGFEMSFLEGALATLGQYRPLIITELTDVYLRDAGASAGEVVETLTALGYDLRTLDSRGHEIINDFDSASLHGIDVPYLIARHSSR